MNNPDTYAELFWGYLVIWMLFFTYILYLGRKVSRLEKETRKNGE